MTGPTRGMRTALPPPHGAQPGAGGPRFPDHDGPNPARRPRPAHAVSPTVRRMGQGAARPPSDSLGPAMIVPALLDIQERYGYLPQEELEFLALRARVPLYRI